MRFSCAFMIAAVALCSCGGGGSSSSPQVLPKAPTGTLTLPSSSGMWSASLGPWSATSSGKLNAIAIDPNNASTIYVAGGIGTDDGVTTDTGVYKTTNGGASWSGANSGLGDTTVNWLIFDASGAALYAATETGGIFRSTDGAQSWQQVSNAQSVRQIVENNGTFYAASQAGVLSSTDGSTWTVFAATEAPANTVDVSGTDIYVGLVDGTVLHVAAASQQRLTDFVALDAPPEVHAIAVDPADPHSIYATMDGMVGGIYTDALMHSADGGATWQTISIPASLRGAQAIAFSRTVPHRLFIAGTGLAYTDDGYSLNMGSGYTGDARTMTVLSGDRLAIASDQGVALGSFNGSFTTITTGLPINIVRSVAVHGSTVVVTMQDFPPARSTDGGATWQTLSVNSTENGNAYINPNQPNLCYILDNGINVSSDGCLSFLPQSIGAHIASTQPFASDPTSPMTYVITENGVFLASDGAHFQPSGWSVPQPVDVAVDPRNGNVFVSSMSGGAAVWHSSNGGKTFTRSNTFVPPGPSYPNDAPVVAVDPSNGAVVAVTETAIYRSTNGGATFAPVQEIQWQARTRNAMSLEGRRLDPDARAHAAEETGGYNIGEHAQFVSSGSGTVLVINNGTGMYVSTDDGTTLHTLRANAVSHSFEGFTTDGQGNLCTGTDGEGVICASLTALSTTVSS